jgi:TonB family protein
MQSSRVAAFLCSMLCASAFCQDRGIVQCDADMNRVPAWTAPGSAQVVEQLSCGQAISIAKLERGYFKIQIDNRLGYVNAKYVRLPESEEKRIPQSEQVGKSPQPPQSLRLPESEPPRPPEPARPSEQTPVIQCDLGSTARVPAWASPAGVGAVAYLSCGQTVSIISRERGDFKIKIGDRIAYLNEKYVRLPQTQAGQIPKTIHVQIIPPDPENPKPLLPVEDLLAKVPSVQIPIDIQEYQAIPIGDISAPPNYSTSSAPESGGGIATGQATGVGPGTSGSIGNAVGPYVAGGGVKPPEALLQPQPGYTDEARKAGIEGIVLVQAIVRKDGTVGGFKVLRGLGYGLDESAINTIATKWRFKPGTYSGAPVDVLANIEISYRLSNKPTEAEMAAAATQPAQTIPALVEENRSVSADQTKEQVLEESITLKASTSQQKLRVFVTDSQSWEMKGAAVVTDSGGGAYSSGGARPQNAEIAKTFGERCTQVTVTINRAKADYIVTLDHEGGKGYARKDNKWASYNQDGDMIGSGSTRSLGNSVKDACEAILNDRGRNR